MQGICTTSWLATSHVSYCSSYYKQRILILIAIVFRRIILIMTNSIVKNVERLCRKSSHTEKKRSFNASCCVAMTTNKIIKITSYCQFVLAPKHNTSSLIYCHTVSELLVIT